MDKDEETIRDQSPPGCRGKVSSMPASGSPRFIGIDVSKAHLDGALLPEDTTFRLPNDAAGWATLCARLRRRSLRPVLRAAWPSQTAFEAPSDDKSKVPQAGIYHGHKPPPEVGHPGGRRAALTGGKHPG